MDDKTERELAKALTTLGFRPQLTLAGGDGLMRPTAFATCLTCGAAVLVPPGVPGSESPIFAHSEWHAREWDRNDVALRKEDLGFDRNNLRSMVDEFEAANGPIPAADVEKAAGLRPGRECCNTPLNSYHRDDCPNRSR